MPVRARVLSRPMFGRPDNRLTLILLWLVLQSLDVLTTALGLRAGLHEANVVAAQIMTFQGELGAYAFKLLVTLAILACIVLLEHRYARVWLALKLVTAYMLFVVAFNAINIALEVAA